MENRGDYIIKADLILQLFRPIVFSMDTNSTYEADFVLATLVDEPQSSQASQAPSVR